MLRPIAIATAVSGMVVPLRFEAPLLFAHVVLVGLPFAFILRRYLRA
jgi:hypothetical protein